jgi:hypothetical protein
VDYAMTHSQDQIQKGRKRAILWAVLFTILGLVAIYKGTFTEGWLADIYLIAGILMIVFQIFNLFYNFVMFPIALKRSVLRELKKAPACLSRWNMLLNRTSWSAFSTADTAARF